ncbi:hypothetical protein BFP71_07150 [Roseivirga misakiensis]|uniref:Uncharacterized protein n=2 Tax=Roseivirga misakiensis TaxID=1563681 RepID=A0A1E5T3B8_9BACT|nr:hypothetical protein BFP71_07150 [Roseivirga misakiensis]
MRPDQNGFSIGLGQASSDLVANKIYSASAMFTTGGRFDYGLLYSTFDNPPVFGFGARVDTFTPNINYLLVKTETGTNLGAGVGYNFALNTVDVNDFVLSASLSQRIGDISRFNVLPFFAVSTTNGNTGSSLGISFVLPGKNYFVVSPSLVSANDNTNFAIELGYIFAKDKN